MASKDKRLIILTFFFLFYLKSVQGQCPNGDSLLSKIKFLQGDSRLSPREQIKIISRYEAGVAACAHYELMDAPLLRQIGNLFYQAGEYSKGSDYYQRRIDLINQNAANDSVNLKDLKPCYYWLSVFYDSLHRITDKMKALDSCVSVAIRLKSIDSYCLWALYSRAIYSFDIGDYHRCIDYANLCESFAMDFARHGSKKDFENGTLYAMISLEWHINALILLERYDEAKTLLEKKANEFNQKKLQNNLGVIYGSLAEVLELKGEFDKVLFYHNKGFAIEKRLGEALNCKAMLNNLGYELWFKHYKNAAKALDYYRRALNYKVTGEAMKILNSLESLSILNRIANVYVLQEKYDDAFRYIQLAFDQIKPGATETDLLNSSLDEVIRLRKVGYIATLIADKASAFYQKYKTIGDLRDIREAVRVYKIADQFLERIKTEQSDVRSKLFWRSNRRRLYEFAIEACHAYGNVVDAFYFFERSRAVLLYDELNELRLMNNEDFARQAQLEKKVIQLDRQLAEKDRASYHSRKLQEDAMIYRQELDQLRKQINARSPLSRHFSETDHIGLRDVQHGLLKGYDKLLEFYDGDSAVYTMIISPDQVFLEKINKDSFDYAVSQFVSYISSYALLNKDFKGFINVSSRLYELIFQKRELPPGKIIVSPGGHYFPIEALIPTTKPLTYLIQDHPISYIHSARLLMIDFNTKKSPHIQNFLGMAPVTFRTNFDVPSLIGSDISLQTLGSNFRTANRLTYGAATKYNFIREFPAYTVIQLYTHATDNENAGEPAIYFADSILQLSELMSEKKPLAKLVVLSACETGRGEWYRGEGVFSFNRGFAALGVPSSISNLWSVDNVSTYRLMELFYKYLAAGLPIDIALQRAKLEFIRGSKERSLPYYWAATILAGKTDAIESEKRFPWKSLAFLLALGGGLFIFGYSLWRGRKKLYNRISKKKTPNE